MNIYTFELKSELKRSGALAYGIDLVEKRFNLHGLKAEKIQVGDAEIFLSILMSLILSTLREVLHHSLNTKKCLDEIVRAKITIYNRRSLVVFYRYWS